MSYNQSAAGSPARLHEHNKAGRLRTMAQEKQDQWREQWTLLRDGELFLFKDWIHPHTLESFRGLDILECGCGGGQHTAFMAPFAKSVTAVDLNTAQLALERNAGASNVRFLDADIAEMDLGMRFDVVMSVGVVHHTDDPDRTVANLIRHAKPGGRLIIWVYSHEGNWAVRNMVEPFRRLFLRSISRKTLLWLSKAVTAILYIPVHTLYRLPLRFLPYFDYFGNFRKLSFYRNTLNVFDKLNAPKTGFITRKRAESWVAPEKFENIHISRYKGVSWRISGHLKRHGLTNNIR
ncbi:MAG: class I SAM-dependent methyltransferase [Nitrospinae bacterium]|nr:class I SAM-dependent methyltransferase [Nitrospinota bacterium]